MNTAKEQRESFESVICTNKLQKLEMENRDFHRMCDRLWCALGKNKTKDGCTVDEEITQQRDELLMALEHAHTMLWQSDSYRCEGGEAAFNMHKAAITRAKSA